MENAHDNMNLDKPIVLIGMMGVGKTTLGQILARQLSLRLYDSDLEIEKQQGKSTVSIFKTQGEAGFRALEADMVQALMNKGPCVIATGGGAIIDDKTREAIKKKAVSIWLDGSLDLLHERLKDKQDRPLLKQDDPKAVLEKLYEERKALYAQADIHFKVFEEETLEAAQRLLKELDEFLN